MVRLSLGRNAKADWTLAASRKDYLDINHWFWRDNNAILAEEDQAKNSARRDESTSRWILHDQVFKLWIRPTSSDNDYRSSKQVLWCQGAGMFVANDNPCHK
jgi:hypothetical protein